jgi:outer membrane protein OmpA-like peptidoglycan-associated protein
MQRKNNPAKKINLKAVDFFIIVFCLAGACASVMAFWREYNTTLFKANEEPVGTIIFKKRNAERKFIDRNVWDRLKQSSPVYNGDRIRTSGLSEAVVIFQDQQTYLTMDESTIIQIFYNDKHGAQIDFSGGNLEIASSSKNVVVSTGESVMEFDGQSRLYKDEDGFSLSVLEGQASFDGNEIESGKMLALDSSGAIDLRPVVAMTSFGSSARVLGKPGEKIPVDFSWNASGFNTGTYAIVEVAGDRTFNNIVDTRDARGVSSLSIPLEGGSYWWRVYPVTGDSGEPASRVYPSGPLEVGYVAAAALFTPAQKAEIKIPGDSYGPFSWSAVEYASAYLFEISANADMSVPFVSRELTQNTVTQSGLDNGRWYWRVTPVYSQRFPTGNVQLKAPTLPSETREFSITRGLPVLSKPVLNSPKQNGKMYTDSFSHWLLWKYDPNAASWHVELADNPNFEKPLVKQNVLSNYFSVPQALLENGRILYWRVSALGGADIVISDVWNFEVVSDAPPSAKPVLAAVPYIPSITFDANTGFAGNPDIERLLTRIAATLKEHGEYKVRIEGHANPTLNPADIAGRQREQTEELQPLSELRAKDVADQLILLGIDSSRLEYYGVGGQRPLTTWEDTNNWWKNRRVEFILRK